MVLIMSVMMVCTILAGDWVVHKIKKKDQKQLDASFDLFIERLKTLIDAETGFCPLHH